MAQLEALARPPQVEDVVRGALPRRVLVRCTSADVSCWCLQDEAPDAAAVLGAGTSAAEPAFAGPAAATPPPGNSLPKDPTKWSADQVQQWFAKHNGGQWNEYAENFDRLTGKQLCVMEMEHIMRIVKNHAPGNPAHGIAIFNDIAELKKQVSSSRSESSPGSATGTAAALDAPLSPCFGCVSC